MPSEFEELQLRVAFIDEATPQLLQTALTEPSYQRPPLPSPLPRMYHSTIIAANTITSGPRVCP
jgi:hypothetical protein